MVDNDNSPVALIQIADLAHNRAYMVEDIYGSLTAQQPEDDDGDDDDHDDMIKTISRWSACPHTIDKWPVKLGLY